MHIAILGAGWAGLAAALELTQAGHQATVFEAARTVGGRARALPVPLPDGRTLVLDNGQHILIGAYTETLRCMRQVGVDVQATLLRLPLALRFPDSSGLQLPDAPAPWNALRGIAAARGWRWADKWALLRTARTWQRQQFACEAQDTVADLCHALPQGLKDGFIDPLCVAALNTPANQASGQVFLRVLQDSLFGGQGSSDLLLPRQDLGQVFPQAAQEWLQAQGALVRLGQRVQSFSPAPQGSGWLVDGVPFGAVLLATPSTEAARLVSQCAHSAPYAWTVALCDWAASAQALRFEAITTVYLQAVPGVGGRTLPLPMLALRSSPQAPAQFVFDRGVLGGPSGLLAFVASASQGEREQITQQVQAQARMQLGLVQAEPVQTVVEKRATFACTPQLQRPAAHIAPGLWACGDYVQGPYPATLEGAVRSGVAAARGISANHS